MTTEIEHEADELAQRLVDEAFFGPNSALLDYAVREAHRLVPEYASVGEDVDDTHPELAEKFYQAETQALIDIANRAIKKLAPRRNKSLN